MTRWWLFAVLVVFLFVLSVSDLASHYVWSGSSEVEFSRTPISEAGSRVPPEKPSPLQPKPEDDTEPGVINPIDDLGEVAPSDLGEATKLEVSTADVSLPVYRHTEEHNHYIQESADEISEIIEPLAGQVGWIDDTRIPSRTARWLTDNGVSMLIGHVTSDVFEPLTTSEEFRRVGSEFVVIHEHGRSVWRVVDESKLDKQDDFVDYAVEQSHNGVPNLWLVTCVPGGERTPNPNWGVSRDIYLWRAELVSTEVSD